jgi:hypothetical protein
VLLIVVFLAGAALGVRCRFIVLIPGGAMAVMASFADGVSRSHGIWHALLEAIAALAALQIGYLAGFVARCLTADRGPQIEKGWKEASPSVTEPTR